MPPSIRQHRSIMAMAMKNSIIGWDQVGNAKAKVVEHQVFGDGGEPSITWQSGSYDETGTIRWTDFDRSTAEVLDRAWMNRMEAIVIPSSWPDHMFHLHGYVHQSFPKKWIQENTRTGSLRPIRHIAVMAGSPQA